MMTKHTLLRRLSLKAITFIGCYMMTAALLVCYFEIGHDKGWPKADQMYGRFHGLVVSAIPTFSCTHLAQHQQLWQNQFEKNCLKTLLASLLAIMMLMANSVTICERMPLTKNCA